MKVLYIAEVTAVGARSGHATSADRLLDVPLALPPQMGGKGGATNPEQLFGAAYAACFGGAVEYLANQQKALDRNYNGQVESRSRPTRSW